ncbi:hypothetical protein ACTG2S_00955 [Aeromonas sp. 82P]|uniref:hypothetical protein n=1 Tax=Aeromonas sp. 82P TaxID=3452726 RepID=UPI003F79E860
MKKNILALSVVTALSSLALAGCGGGGDGASTNNGNNSGNGGNATKPALTATFIDSAVAGLNYKCGNYSDVTNSQGQFLFNDGDTCTFKLGSIQLGETQVKKGQTLVTPYTIAEKGDKDRAIRIAALLQTMHTDGDIRNGIILNPEDTKKLGNLNFDNDIDFETSLNEALKQAQIDKKVVDTKAAEVHMNASLANANGKSVAVDKVLRGLLEESQDWQKTNFEEKLGLYKNILEQEESVEGMADREIVKAIITMMEITNDPIVSKRFEIEPSSDSAIGSGYKSTLAKVLDIIVNSGNAALSNIKEQPDHTIDIAQLMHKYAVELEAVSNSLASITDPDYLAKYGDSDELTLSFTQVQELRASALAMAAAINVMASYQYGSPSQYRIKWEDLTLDTFSITNNFGGTNLKQPAFGNVQINAEYMNVNINPESFFKDPNFLALNSNHSEILDKAKKQLQKAIELTLKSNLPETDHHLDRNVLEKLHKHLAGDSEFKTVELHDYVLINDEWLEATYNVDLNFYFKNGLGRKDMKLTTTSHCNFDGETIGEYDITMSKALDTAMCKVEKDKVMEIFQKMDGSFFNIPFYGIGNAPSQNGTTINFAQGIAMQWSVNIDPTEGGNFDKVFISCKGRIPGYMPEQEWQNMPCAKLISSTLTNM